MHVQKECTEHGRQRQGAQQRQKHGHSDRHAELEEELANRPAHERHRQEDRHDGQRCGDSGEGDLAGAPESGLLPFLAVFPVAVDIFQDQNGIIHNHAYRQRQSQERHQVDRERLDAEEPHAVIQHEKGPDQRCRNRQADVECGSDGAQEQEADHRGQSNSQEQGQLQLRHILADEDRVIHRDVELDALGKESAEIRKLLLDVLADSDQVAANGLAHPDGHRRHAIESSEAASILQSVLHHGQIAQVHGLAIALGDQELIEFRNGIRLAHGAKI